jgi:dTDP-glucose pyrophosphorylase
MNFKKSLIHSNASIKKAIEKINKSGSQIALVVKNGFLIGTVTDGDIRRGILNEKNLNNSVKEIMNKNFISLPDKTSKQNILKYMSNKNIRQIPLVNNKGKVKDLILLNDLIQKKNLNTVVIMAGGRGKRLGKLTNTIPKPMLKINNKPIIENIMNNCIDAGFVNFYFSVNYLKKKIKNYFKNGSRWKIKINYLEEKKSLGTAGSIRLLPNKIKDPILVINGDLVSQVNFDALLKFHHDNNSDITICVKKNFTKIQYGVVEVDNTDVVNLLEKPTYTFFTNAGIYIINPAICKMIKKNIFLDMSDLILKAKINNKKISAFPIHEFWEDVGLPDTFQKIKIGYIDK